jgi:hypothetical protein
MKFLLFSNNNLRPTKLVRDNGNSLESLKNAKYKHQIPNKSQITILNDQNILGQDIALFEFSNFGHWNLFDVCNLIFGISKNQ